MGDSRAMFIKSLDLETIEEEDADYLSQYSRNKLKNGGRRNDGGQSRPQSQANTITTYETQQTDFLDANSLAYLNVNNTLGSRRNSLFKQGVGPSSGIGGRHFENAISVDKWDRNYYYNNYDPRDPFGLYLAKNPKAARRRRNKSSRMAKCLSCFGWASSSVRYFIIALSFLAIASLFANLQLFNLVALYAERELLPPFLQQQSTAISKPTYSPDNWGFAPTANTVKYNKDADLELLRAENLLIGEVFEGHLNRNESLKGNGTIEGSDGESSTLTYQQNNKDIHHVGELLLLDKFIQSLLFSVPGLGILIGHFPIVWLIRHFGGHKVIFAVLLLSATVTAIFPFIIGLDKLYIVFARFLLGLSFAPTFTFIGTNAAKWATIDEQLFFILVGFLAVQFGPALSWISAVKMLGMDHLSRIRLFGLHSAISTLLAIIWLLFYRDCPQKYKLVNGEELHWICRGKPIRNRRPQLAQSLRSMLLRSVSAWACWITAFCYFFAQLSLHIFLPVFSFKVLRRTVDITITTPFVLLLFSHLFVHWLGPCFGSTSTWKVRIFNSAAFLFSAFIFLGVTIIPRDYNYEFRSTLLLWLCLLPLGLCSAGFINSAVVCGRFFTKHIVAQMQITFGLAYFLIPTLVFALGSPSSIVHWRLLFLSTALVLLLGLALFVILGRGSTTSWADRWAEEAKWKETMPMITYVKRGDGGNASIEFAAMNRKPFE